ncbi:MAG: hypothetical protein AABO41_26405 [Acidobacteriota bacterium]
MSNQVVFILQATSGQSRIAPILVDRWFSELAPWIAVLGASLGLLVALVWLPRVLPIPHADDARRARRRVLAALCFVVILSAGSLLLYASLVYSFNNRIYPFAVVFADVFMTLKTFTLILIAISSFLAVVALCSRFVGRRSYRYMLIRW